MSNGDGALLNLPVLLIGTLLAAAAITYILRRMEWLILPLSALFTARLFNFLSGWAYAPWFC